MARGSSHRKQGNRPDGSSSSSSSIMQLRSKAIAAIHKARPRPVRIQKAQQARQGLPAVRAMTKEVRGFLQEYQSGYKRACKQHASKAWMERGKASLGRAREPIPGYLALMDSGIDGVVSGVRCQRVIEKGEILIAVLGDYRDSDLQTKKELDYSFGSFKYPEHVSLECFRDTRSTIVKYVNSCQGTRRRANVEVVWMNNYLAVMTATRRLAIGEELLMDYPVPREEIGALRVLRQLIKAGRVTEAKRALEALQ